MLGFFSLIGQVFKLLKNIPYFFLIILANILSGAFSFIGIPMLVPALQYLNDDQNLNKSNDVLTNVAESILNIIGISVTFNSIVLFSAFFLIMSQIMMFLIELLQKYVQVKIIKNENHNLIYLYQSAEWSWLTSDSTGKFQSIINREIESYSETCLNSMRLISTFIQCTFYITLAFIMAFNLTSISIIFFFILIFFNIVISNKIKKISNFYNKSYITLSTYISGLSQNKKFLKSSGNSFYFINLILSQSKTTFNQLWNVTYMIYSINFINTTLSICFIITIFLFHDLLNLDFSTLIVIMLIFLRLSPQVNSLTNIYAKISELLPIYNSVDQRVKSLKDNQEKFGDKKYIFDSKIIFKNVEFFYNKDKPLIDKLDFNILPKRTTAFIGRSGSGKSTILDLILGLLKPKNGKIFYGDINSVDLDFRSFRKRVAYVSQETTLIDSTIYDNLVLRNPNISKAKVEEVCKITLLDELIESLPDRYNSRIGENGILLSGGQKQRIAIARALILNPEIIILDESTSNLDLESEKYIIDSLINLKSKITIIIVAHRLNIVKFADVINLVDEGKIIESGSYSDLLKLEGKFKNLIDL